MTANPKAITLKHIHKACQMFDAGEAAPRRQVQSLFIILDGQRYPAKFIRNLALRLATGSDGGKSDGGRGDSVINFFEAFGIETQRGLSQLVRVVRKSSPIGSRSSRGMTRS